MKIIEKKFAKDRISVNCETEGTVQVFVDGVQIGNYAAKFEHGEYKGHVIQAA